MAQRYPPRSRQQRRFAIAATLGVLLLAGSVVAGLALTGHLPIQRGTSGAPLDAAATTNSAAAHDHAHSSASASPSATPGNTPTTSARNRTPRLPDAVVMAYFTAINHRDWPLVWRLGGKNFGASYAQMVQGFSQTQHDSPTIIATDAGSVSVLLVAVQVDGQTQIYQGVYQVRKGAVRRATVSLRATQPAESAKFPSLIGTWTGHGRLLGISRSGLGIAQFRTYRSCATSPVPPCDSVSGNTIYPGGVIVFQLTSQHGRQAYGIIEGGSTLASSGRVAITFRPATDTVALVSGRQRTPVSYCGAGAPAGYCGA